MVEEEKEKGREGWGRRTEEEKEEEKDGKEEED